MLGHYAALALRGWRRTPVLTALIVLALGLGIAACMTTLAIYHVLAADPIPAKSARLFNVQLDAQPREGFGAEPNAQLTRYDAEALIRAAQAPRQVMMAGGSATLIAADGRTRLQVNTRRATEAVFALLDVPLAAGQGWTHADDATAAPVAVISTALAQRFFGDANPLGRTLTLADVPMDVVDGVPGRLGRTPLRIIGVIASGWRPTPHYFDLAQGAYAKPADLFLPFATALALRQSFSGRLSCWGNTRGQDPLSLAAPCDWVQYWAELASPADAPAFLTYLNAYSAGQHEVGRFERPPNARLTPVRAWLTQREVIPADVTLQVVLALAFLLVCLVNTVCLLLARTLRRAGEIGIRRALGATRGAIFAQSLVESALLGLAGAALGVVLTLAGLAAVRGGRSDYATLVQMDGPVLAATLAIALAASQVAGLWPAWRAAHLAPALQVKTL
ncbi:MAG: ABC transporter permease [Proteobacteria bacterium]|nr:ABC transporter permease [Pseudomonadota bacterium]